LYPLDIEFGKLSSFLSEDNVLSWHVEIKSQRLHRFREMVCELLSRLTIPINDPYINYTPHATLAYGSEGDAYLGEIPEGVAHLSKLCISSKKRISN
jgi:2'-5' RNA ligase